MIDALIALQASVTKTATFTGGALTLPAGTPFRGDKVRVIYSAATNASGSNSVTFQIAVSKDGGSTFNVEAQADPIALSTTAQSGELTIRSLYVQPAWPTAYRLSLSPCLGVPVVRRRLLIKGTSSKTRIF